MSCPIIETNVQIQYGMLSAQWFSSLDLEIDVNGTPKPLVRGTLVMNMITLIEFVQSLLVLGDTCSLLVHYQTHTNVWLNQSILCLYPNL